MGLDTLDLVVIAAYLAGVTLFGLRFRGKQRTVRDYFLADKAAPWWAISLSIVAAETSTLTVISVPALAYQSDFQFLQLVIGYLVGRVVVVLLLIPHYFRGDLVTAYQLIDRRFGQKLRALTAGLFLVTRAAAEGVRVFAVAIVVKVALDSVLPGMNGMGRDISAIAIVLLLTLAYTFRGGMAAVIWTDVVQLSVYLAGCVVALVVMLHAIPGGSTNAFAIAAHAGRFRMFSLKLNLTTTYTLWSGVIGGAFLTTASHGTDQLIVQRLLSASSELKAKIALLVSGLAVFFQFALFLFIGAMLFVFYKLFAPPAPFTRADIIFPSFIVTRMPHGVSGLLIAAIVAAAMSNLSAALNSLSSTTIVDFYARLAPSASEEDRVRRSQIATLFWGVILFVLALVARRGGTVLEMGLSIASVAYGSLLGVFLLGVLTERASERGAIVGMIFGFALNVYLWRFTPVAFTWYVVIGSIATFLIGLAASCLPPSANSSSRPTIQP
ncbi:MAG TPA: sodium:solute symporter [Terracidiphilus sp.]|nr:sodium:solute symporter [Terracidiphilus sp.]